MNLDEALDILKDNSYILEKLEYSEDRFAPITDISPRDRIKKIATQQFGNDGNSFKHSGIGTKKWKDIYLDDYQTFKKLILNGGIFGKRKYNSHIYIKDDLLNIVDKPSYHSNVLSKLKQDFEIDVNDLKRMIEDKNQINDAFDKCLKCYFLYLKTLFLKTVNDKTPIYRGIHLPEEIDVNEYLKKHKYIGTSWTLNIDAAYNFADSGLNTEKGYVLTSYVDTLDNIDITTSMLWWYRLEPFADNSREDELRIRDSSKLKIVDIEEV